MTLIILSTYALLLLLLILLIVEKIKHAKTKAELRREKMFSEMMEQRCDKWEIDYYKLLSHKEEEKTSG